MIRRSGIRFLGVPVTALIPTLLVLGLGAGLATGPLGCARNPVTGKSELALVSESQEIEMGKQAAQEVAQTIGIYNDNNVQSYVAGLGKRIAANSERPNLPWEFHVVEDASVNAFALPGGFIYVTRGLMTSINDEAELATVVGHEIGHVTNRHSVQQISKSELAQLGLGIGSILSSDIAQFGQLASAGLSVLFLKYSRDAENQADQAGFRYALQQGYDVREMAKVMETLDRISQTGGGGKLPEWLATHPNPGNRIKHIQQMLDTTHVDLSRAKVNREDYLRRIQGMTFGEDPRQGYFEGTHFYHPQMRFQLHFPDGWQVQNTAASVAALSPNQDAIIQLALAGKGSPQQAAQQFLSQQGVQAGQTSSTNINGLPATSSYFQAQTQQGVIEGLVTFLEYGGTTFGLMGYTAQGKLASYDQVFQSTIRSFSELRDGSKINVQPARVELVKLDRDMTLQQFNAQYPSNIPIEQLAIINEVPDASTVLPTGRMVKRVVGGIKPKSS
ncbi:MAG TPA: M48 family metalloprotease [Gemmatimonadales bacterium]|nr:M48 family metalloprotease [Gemmatimonadales bacterium]